MIYDTPYIFSQSGLKSIKRCVDSFMQYTFMFLCRLIGLLWMDSGPICYLLFSFYLIDMRSVRVWLMTWFSSWQILLLFLANFFRPAGKMIISSRLRLGQIIFIGALINCLSLYNPLITTISHLLWMLSMNRKCQIFNILIVMLLLKGKWGGNGFAFLVKHAAMANHSWNIESLMFQFVCQSRLYF